ncbi:glycosyltransferase [Aeromonas veronii]
MKVSIVINTYNRMHTLPNTLAAIKYIRYPDIEVIVVDGPSTDGTWDYLNDHWKDEVKIVKCPVANLSVSRNIGIMHSTGDIICFTDDDGIPEASWIDVLVNNYSNPKVAAVGGYVRDNSGVSFQTRNIISSRTGFSEVDVPESKLEEKLSDELCFTGLIGVNSSFRREALVEIGGFDEEYAYYLDETDVLVRLVDKGYKIIQDPSAEVHHKYAPSHIRKESGAPQTLLQIFRSISYFCSRNMFGYRDLTDVYNTISIHKEHYKNHLSYLLAANVLEEDNFNRLLNEIEIGSKEGIFDSYSKPRSLIKEVVPLSARKIFHTTLSTEKRLRLVFITPDYPPDTCGGVGVFIHVLAESLAKLGHEITVVVTHGSDYVVDFVNNVWVHRLPRSQSTSFMCEDLPELPAEQAKVASNVLAEIDRINHMRNFDLVIGTIWDLDISAVIASGRYVTAMYLVTSYALMLDSKPEWKRDAHYFEAHVKKMIVAEAWAINNVNYIFSSTNQIFNDFKRAYNVDLEHKNYLVPFGVRDVSKQSVIDKPGRLKILFVGRFETRKGIHVLLEAIPSILDKYDNVEFILVGNDEIEYQLGCNYKRDFLTRHKNNLDIINRVYFEGVVSDSSLLEHYMGCDIFVAPSLYESFGLIYIEAMRFAKPCIGCSIGGISEVIDDRVNGILVEPNNVKQLSTAIERLIDDKELRNNMGMLGREKYDRIYSETAFSQRFELTVNKILSKEVRYE